METRGGAIFPFPGFCVGTHTDAGETRARAADNRPQHGKKFDSPYRCGNKFTRSPNVQPGKIRSWTRAHPPRRAPITGCPCTGTSPLCVSKKVKFTSARLYKDKGFNHGRSTPSSQKIGCSTHVRKRMGSVQKSIFVSQYFGRNRISYE